MDFKKVILTILLAILLIFGLILLVSFSNKNAPARPADNTIVAEEEPETIHVNLDIPEEYNAVFEKYEGEKGKEDTVILIGILKQIGLEHIKSVSSYVKGTYIEAYESENNEQSYTARLDNILETFEDTEKFYIKLNKSEDGFISGLSISDIEGFSVVQSDEEVEVEEE